MDDRPGLTRPRPGFGPGADLLEEKKSAPAFLQRRPDAVHMYGVDLMSTDNIIRYFKGACLRCSNERL